MGSLTNLLLLLLLLLLITKDGVLDQHKFSGVFK
jgi:hypothetical protein